MVVKEYRIPKKHADSELRNKYLVALANLYKAKSSFALGFFVQQDVGLGSNGKEGTTTTLAVAVTP